MVRGCEEELGRSVLWSPGSNIAVRSWVSEGQPVSTNTPSTLLAKVREELIAARSLRRSPYRRVAAFGGFRDVPEMVVVSHWACRRRRDLGILVQEARRNKDSIRSKRDLRTSDAQKKQRRDLNEELSKTEKILGEARRLRGQLGAMFRVDELLRVYQMGSLSQRDYRIRRLLRAFAPPREQSVSLRPSAGVSHYAPTVMNKIFEIWGGVWIVQVLRTLGFAGKVEKVEGIDVVSAVQWVLRRGSVSVIIDYEPHPEYLDVKSFDDLPPLSARQDPAFNWGIKRRLTEGLITFVAAADKCSPDYLIRIEGPGGRTLAVGDACLADPLYHTQRTKDFKPSIVARYRGTIFWVGEDFIQECDPLGGFVVFPGPTEQWAAMDRKCRELDSWAFCPHPSKADESADYQLRSFMERLVRLVC